jgi:hypothetical protein
MKVFSKYTLLLITLFSVSLQSCKKDEEEPIDETPTETKGNFRIEFEHKFGAADFDFGTAYTNSSSEQLTFSTVKYYVSDVKLTKTDGSTWSAPNSYYLVDVSNAVSTLITIPDVPTADYKGFSFTLGVDSTRNVSGDQTGALDPANSMFWSWNTGYIFTKIEGTSPQITDMGGAFEYHLGGFKESNGTNAIKYFSHNFSGEVMSIKPTATPQVHMVVDIAQIFNGANTLSVATTPMVHMPGAMAVGLQTNFASGFEYEHLHN